MKLFSIANMLLVCSIFLSSMQLSAQNFVFPTITSKDGTKLNASLAIKGIRVTGSYETSFNFEVIIEVDNKYTVSSNDIRNNTFYNYDVAIFHTSSNVKTRSFNKNFSGLVQVDTIITDKTYGPYTYKGASASSLGLESGVLYSEPNEFAFLGITHATLWVHSANFDAKENAEYTLMPSIPEQPLAVTLTSFSAHASGNTTKLSWVTSYEKDSKSFVIERSGNGFDWAEIATVQSKSDNGDHDIVNDYEYVDVQPLDGNNYYRLKMVDYFDKFEYSKIVNVSFSLINEDIIVFYPNPVKDVLYIKGLESSHQITFVNTLGQMVQKYTNVQNISTTQLNKGTYFVHVTNSDNKVVATSKIIKQ